MSRRQRMVVFGVGATLLGALLVLAIAGLPKFGTAYHPYGSRAVDAALQHKTPNVVSSINFDQRGMDTLGEELILFTALAGTLVILRNLRDEVEDQEERRQLSVGDDMLPAISLVTYLFLAFATLVGIYIVAHGHLSPGGGFQGGVILGTAIHLLYVGGGYRAIRQARPTSLYELGEALGAGGFVVLAISGLAVSGSLVANMLPFGSFNTLTSAGTVEIFNALVGLEVSSAMIVLLGRFLEQYAEVRRSSA